MRINAEKTNLNELLGIPNRQFVIPPYQRPYAWEPEQIDELWDDLVQTLGSGHFMGSIVLNCESPEAPEVIDGQQRLTTLLLLLALIRDQYATLKPDLVYRVQQFLENTHADAEGRFKLRTGNANWPVFRDFVLRRPDDAGRKQ